MLEELCKDPEIRNYLNSFPKDQMITSVYLTLLYGIRQLKSKLSIIKISTIENLIGPANLQKPKKRGSFHLQNSKLNSPTYERSSLSANLKEKISNLNRLSSPTISEKKAKIVPNYLKNVQSIIKPDIQKDLAIHQYKKEIFAFPVHSKNFNKSLPDLLEVAEPSICPLATVTNKRKELEIGKLAENFLKNRYTRVLSP